MVSWPGGLVDESSVDEFREFVVTRWQALVRTAYLLVGDHGLAEDLVQTALERVHRRWDRVERRDQPEVYARRVLINLAISWRRRRRVHEIPVAAVADATGSDVERPDLGDAVWTAVRRLPPRMRAVVVLRYVEDRSEAEAADLLGCSVGTVKSAASRGLARIRDQLQAAHGGTFRSDGSRVDANPRRAGASRIEVNPTGRSTQEAASIAGGTSSNTSFGRRFS
jgi:RNA polymerase sigma-70 factor (sigma-E family)